MKPKALRSGDTIAMVSPASPVTPEKLKFAQELLEGQGYRVTVAPHALERDGYLAGDDRDRAQDLREAFSDPDVDGVLCTRGGYGCARLLPYLDLDFMARSGKLFAGFSDITTLHLALNRRGLPTLHSPMALTLSYPREPWVVDSFLRSLQGDLSVSEAAPKGKCVRSGKAKGRLVGGCLCLIADAMGTGNQIDPEGKILLIEDVDEAPHRVDAMFTHLRNGGVLDKVSGVVVGEMTRTDEREDRDIGARDWRSIVRERLSDLQVPVMMEYPFGHAKNMLTLGLGLEIEMDADAGTIAYLEALCA